MAIRIDLLPRYVGLRRWFKRVLLACISLVGVLAVVLFAFYYSEQLQLQTLQENRDAFEKVAKLAEEETKKKEQFVKDAQPLRDTVSFFVDAGRTGPERAALVDIIQRYIYRGAVISLLDLSDGQNVKLSAMVRTPDEYANLLNVLRRGTVPTGIAFKNLPSGAGIKGWPGTSGGATQAGGQQAAAQPGTGGATDTTSLGYQIFPNSITLQGAMRDPIVVPVPPGDVPVVTNAPGAPPA